MTTAFAIIGIALSCVAIFYNGAIFGKSGRFSWFVLANAITIAACLVLLVRR